MMKLLATTVSMSRPGMTVPYNGFISSGGPSQFDVFMM